MSVYESVSKLFELIQLIIFVRILLSWFPNINWWQQPFKLINDLTEPILSTFRRLIPPLGGLDLSPIVALLALQILESMILHILASFM